MPGGASCSSERGRASAVPGAAQPAAAPAASTVRGRGVLGSPCVHGSNGRKVAQGWQGAGISRCFEFTSQIVVNVECFCRFDSLGEEVNNA